MSKIECINCEKATPVKRKVEYTQLGVSLGKFDALVCSSCGETLFEGSVSEQIEKKAKEKIKNDKKIVQ